MDDVSADDAVPAKLPVVLTGTHSSKRVVSVPWDGKHVHFRSFEEPYATKFLKARLRIFGEEDRLLICPLCVAPLKQGSGSIILVISNQAGIPNRVLHAACFDQGLPEYIVKRLADLYAEAQREMPKYAHWFN